MSILSTDLLHSVMGEDNQLVVVIVGAAAILATTTIYYTLSSKFRSTNSQTCRASSFTMLGASFNDDMTSFNPTWNGT